MSEPAFTSVAEPSSNLSSASPKRPCDRCGTFLEGAPTVIGPRSVCANCAAALRQELRLYPYGYIVGLGILLNFAVAAVLSAICWKRLGDPARTRTSVGFAVAGVLWIAILIKFEAIARLTLPINAGITLAALGTYKHTWLEHKRAGGARANLWLPVLVSVGIFAALVAGYVAYAAATGQLTEEG